jgi:hypothetical protein
VPAFAQNVPGAPLEVAGELLEENPDVEASECFERVCVGSASGRRLAGHGQRPYGGLNT